MAPYRREPAAGTAPGEGTTPPRALAALDAIAGGDTEAATKGDRGPAPAEEPPLAPSKDPAGWPKFPLAATREASRAAGGDPEPATSGPRTTVPTTPVYLQQWVKE